MDQMTTRKRSASDFIFADCIGEGSYSKVYKAISKQNGLTYAVKILNKQHIHKEQKRKYVTIEKNTLNLLGKHPGIVTLYYTFQDSTSLYFVIDYAKNGELLNLIHKLGSLSEKLTKYYTIQLVDTLLFIHGKGIIHRDLKPENILLGNDWKLMITDFGAAKVLDGPTDDENGNSSGSFVGTAEYVSPELLEHNQSGVECDYWALGCIVYQMIVGKPPFKEANEYETFLKIIEGDYKWPSYSIPLGIKNLVEKLLKLNPSDRYNLKEVQMCKWFKDVKWDDRSAIWGNVPKLEVYDHTLFTNMINTPKIAKKATVTKINGSLNNMKGLSTVESQRRIVKQQAEIERIEKYSNPTQLQSGNGSVDNDRIYLKKQLNNSHTNQQLMNVLTNRVYEKKSEVNNNSVKPLPNLHFSAKKIPATSAGHIEIVTDSKLIGSNSRKSISSIITNNNSNKSVIIHQKRKSVSTPEPEWKNTHSSTVVSTVPVPASVPTPTPNPAPAPAPTPLYLKKSVSVNEKLKKSPSIRQSPTMSANFQFPPRRVVSSDAVIAAGAVGTLLTHKRLNSNNFTKAQYKQLNSSQLINPILLDRSIPSAITNKLFQNERILKLDNIFKSELPHKPNQYVKPPDTLTDSILQRIIQQNGHILNKDLKPCIMVVTSLARLLIYELNSDFKLRNPQSSTLMQAQEFYSKVVEVRLTNKSISLYDYEFDEILKEGYLILELANVNKLVFLSAWDKGRIIKGGLNSNVRVGFVQGENIGWVDSLLTAKELLRKHHQIQQMNRQKIATSGAISTKNGKSPTSPKKKVEGSFTSRLRSFSGSGNGSFGESTTSNLIGSMKGLNIRKRSNSKAESAASKAFNM
ncbi:protein kinase [Martiniozyma asiatica (nom. inval.)]|nr:protein kinase [Martiniozyma asiatica]